MKKRLIKDQGFNSPEEYDRIFLQRQKKGVDWADERRWKALVKHYKGGRLLDIGALDSKIVEFIDPHNYYGWDTASESIKAMRKKYPLGEFSNIDFMDKKIMDEGYKEMQEMFSYVVMGEVLEHMENVEEAIERAFWFVKCGGILAISVPLLEENELGAVDLDRHIWSFSANDIVELVEPYAKDVKIKILRSKWFPIYKYSWPTIICHVIKI